jgi:hypothetical protein
MSIVDSSAEAMETNFLHSTIQAFGSQWIYTFLMSPWDGIRSTIMADPVPNLVTQSGDARQSTLLPVEHHVAFLLGQGLTVNQISARLSRRVGKSHSQVRRWIKERLKNSQEFRDLVWDASLLQIEEQAGAVQRGLLNQARKGRVDAARLLYELNGRHNPKAEGLGIQAVQIVVGGEIPRPISVEVPETRRELNGQRLEEDETVVELTTEVEDEE